MDKFRRTGASCLSKQKISSIGCLWTRQYYEVRPVFQLALPTKIRLSQTVRICVQLVPSFNLMAPERFHLGGKPKIVRLVSHYDIHHLSIRFLNETCRADSPKAY